MTRRRLLRLGLTGLAVLSNLFGSGRRRAAAAANPTFPSPIRADLAAHFSYLTFEVGTIEAFALAYHTHYGSPDLRNGFVAMAAHTKFLLSTDFFQNGADETKPIRFVALYDPYITPCYNPLARFD